jgi:hypothetical protein
MRKRLSIQQRGGKPMAGRDRKIATRPPGTLWIPASNYYVLSFAIGAGIFFLIWGSLREGGDPAPWIPAGVAFSGFIVVSVIGREVILRRVRNRRIAIQRAFDRQLADVQSLIGEQPRRTEKLTLERNESMLREIRRKSEAADAFASIAAAHREVFELCAAYLVVNDRELPTVAAGSPRLPALGKGRDYASRLHRIHLMQWAQIESRDLARQAASKANGPEKFELTNRAIRVVETALSHYPTEPALLESRDLLSETMISLKVADFVEDAERAAFKGDYAAARSSYRDALFYLGRDGVSTDERERAAEQIRSALDRLAAAGYEKDLR